MFEKVLVAKPQELDRIAAIGRFDILFLAALWQVYARCMPRRLREVRG